jgi:hypothetical protein
MKDIEKAKNFLEKGNYSFVAVKNGQVIAASQEDGIKPLIKIIRKNKSMLKESSIADKVIGKASGLLILYVKAKEAHGYIMSKTAMEVFNNKDFSYTHDKEVDYILNNTGDDMCPMEKTTMNITRPNRAYIALEKKIKELMTKK